MEKNKIGKYLKYAIGEIVLVVIGILIALSINNWNENRKYKASEIKTLKIIRDVIAQDTSELNTHRFWLSVAANGIKNAKAELSREQSSDSLGLYLNLSLMQFDFKLNRAPYESLKANSPNIISNDSLRNAIINFYEYQYQFIESSNGQMTGLNKILLTHSIDLFKNISRYDNITENSWYERILVPHDLEALKNDIRFQTLLNTKLSNIRHEYHFSYTQGLKNLTKMLEAINSEIKRLE